MGLDSQANYLKYLHVTLVAQKSSLCDKDNEKLMIKVNNV